MKNKNFFVVLIATFSFTEAISGGEFAKPGEFPHTVQLSMQLDETSHFFCGGSILSSTVIITAAHCLSEGLFYIKTEEVIKVTAGSLKLKENVDKRDGVQIRTVSHYIFHPKYISVFNINDIALLFLNSPLKFTEKVQPIRLPSMEVTYSRGTFAGWGVTDWRNVTSPHLKKIDLEIDKKKSCDKLKWFHVGETELCSKMSSGAELRSGDSGSSLICMEHKSSRPERPFPVACGILSWSRAAKTCGESMKKGVSVFVDVSKYLHWIQYTIKMEKERSLEGSCSLNDEVSPYKAVLGLIGEVMEQFFELVENETLLGTRFAAEWEKMMRKLWWLLYSTPIIILLLFIISEYLSNFFQYSVIVFTFLFTFTLLFFFVAIRLLFWF